jgi:hypothetical protein
VCGLWGETNGGQTWSWDHTNWWDAGVWGADSYPSTNITGLTGGKTYYYTFGATNATTNGVAWLPVSFVVPDSLTNETTLTVTAGAGGTVTPSGATVVIQGVPRAVSATANTCYSFTNWSVTSGMATIGNSNAANTLATIFAPAVIRANFAVTDPDADTDDDGMTDGEEDLAGTDPNDPKSVLRITAFAAAPPVSNCVVVTWQSATGRAYTVQAATNLLAGFHTNLLTGISATPPQNVHTDNVGSAGQKFYRIKLDEP